ncbi:TPA: hypothetical protein QFT23_003667 [Bacillus cereus]|nr:hypothetical protein [Bacillus cereus]
MNEIVFILEFYDESACSRANEYLKLGWTLLHVGTKAGDTYNEHLYYTTTYVVGANQKQYDEYNKRDQ